MHSTECIQAGHKQPREIAQECTTFPQLNGYQPIGLGVASYALRRKGSLWVLRVSTGHRGSYIWLPLCIPERYVERLQLAYGDAKLFRRGSDWYVMLPIRVTPTPAVRDGEPTFIGVDWAS